MLITVTKKGFVRTLRRDTWTVHVRNLTGRRIKFYFAGRKAKRPDYWNWIQNGEMFYFGCNFVQVAGVKFVFRKRKWLRL